MQGRQTIAFRQWTPPQGTICSCKLLGGELLQIIYPNCIRSSHLLQKYTHTANRSIHNRMPLIDRYNRADMASK